MSKILEISNLRKEYNKFLLKDISFSLERGYIMGFIGPNGAGKSTTIKLIMNLINKDSGKIKIFDMDNEKYDTDIKQKIGFVYDENYFYVDLSIKTLHRIIAPVYKKWDSKKFNNYLSDFDLDPNKKIKQLSKGMKMKFSLAVALSHDAELIIMDEPTSGLDPVFRSEILEILSDIIQDERKSVLFSTHITSDLERIADYITFINDGEIVLSCPKYDILENYKIVKGKKSLLDNNIKRIAENYRENSFNFEALVSNINKIDKAVRDELTIEKPTLDDIMIFTARGEKSA